MPDSATLGWKSNDDTKCSPYNRLKTADDVANAFRILGGHLKSSRRTRPVYMEIANLVCYISVSPTVVLGLMVLPIQGYYDVRHKNTK